MGFGGGMFGQPGERETTQHGTVNDITVPTLRLRQLLIFDEIYIAALLLLFPIGATLIGKWVFPVFITAIVIALFRNALQDIETWNELWLRLFYLSIVCFVVFSVGALMRDAVSSRLQQGLDALWQWPPKVGLFLNRIAFLFLPFFIPIFTRIPLLTGFFKTTLLDPTWPSPRTAIDKEGIQYPDAVENIEEDDAQPPAIYPITALGRKKSHGKPTSAKLQDWFAPNKNANGLAEFGKAILENRATFSEKGSRKTSPHPKLGALYYGFTQEEYAKLRKIGEKLGLIEKNGVGYDLTDKGIETVVSAIAQTLGEDTIPKGYEDWL